MIPVPIPILDLSTTDGDELVASLIGSSCVFITGHGLSPDQLDALLRASREFFELPEHDKARVQWSGELPWKGWQPVHSAGSGRMLLERFEVTLAPDPVPGSRERWADSFDQWPAQPASFRAVWTETYAQLHRIASEVTHLIADGLDAPADDVAAWTSAQHANLVVHHYLAQHERPDPGEVRYQPHTDIGGVTLLWADDAPGGLEARLGAEGTWVPVVHPPGALLVQAGDLLHRWSRGRIPANVHRVANPPDDPDARPRARYSVAYFHHPDLRTWVAPADLTDDSTGDAGGDGVHAFEHVLERQRQLGRTQAPRSI